MGLVAVTETAQMFQQKNIVLTERDKEFVVQFAFRTNDRELTNKLIDELTEAGAGRDAVCRKYQALTGLAPDWVQRIENLLVSLEMYRAGGTGSKDLIGTSVCLRHFHERGGNQEYGYRKSAGACQERSKFIGGVVYEPYVA